VKTRPLAHGNRRARALRLARLGAVAACVVLLAVAIARAAPQAETPKPAPQAETPKPAPHPAAPKLAPALELEDALAPFTPIKARTAADEDRLQAIALFAAGRMAEQKQDYAKALRLYQRARRYDPPALPILREIVPLAFNLNRNAEAVRYALLAAEAEPTDLVLLRRLALYSSQSGDFPRAIKLYEKAIASQPADKPTPMTVLLSMEVGRVYYLAKQYNLASDRFALVSRALADPKAFGMDDNLRKAILDEEDLTYQLFGESLLEAGRFDEAEAAFKKSHEAKASPAELAFNLARVEAKKKRLDEALGQLEKYFAAKSTAAATAPYELLETVLQGQGKADKFSEKLEVLRKADPANTPLAYFIARRYQTAGRPAEAEALYRQIVEREPTSVPIEAYEALAELYHGKRDADGLLSLLGRMVSALGSLSPMEKEAGKIAADAAMIDALAARARPEKDKPSSNTTAKADFGKSAAVAHLAIAAKKFELAREFVELALQGDAKKAPGLLMALSLDLLVAERYAEAAQLLERGLPLVQTPAQKAGFHFYLASALEMSSKTDAALDHARKAADIDSTSPRFQSRVAWILYHAKQYDNARAEYQKFLDKFDANHESGELREVLRDARLAMSNLEVNQNHMPQAEEWLEQVLDEFPEDVGASNDLGYLWADQGKRLIMALRLIEHAVAAEPDNAAYRDSLGWALYRLNRFDEAILQLKKAAAVPQPDGVILDHLGDALVKAGKPGEAIKAWSKAAEAFVKESDKAKLEAVRQKIAALRQQVSLTQKSKS